VTALGWAVVVAAIGLALVALRWAAHANDEVRALRASLTGPLQDVRMLMGVGGAEIPADPNAPYPGFLNFRAKARAHEERRKA